MPGISDIENANLEEHVAEKYELSTVYNWWAIRGMMLLFPAVSLLFGVTYALLASCCSVIFLGEYLNPKPLISESLKHILSNENIEAARA